MLNDCEGNAYSELHGKWQENTCEITDGDDPAYIVCKW
jgi:hypothetical protein